jgi:hypothetical protein
LWGWGAGDACRGCGWGFVCGFVCGFACVFGAAFGLVFGSLFGPLFGLVFELVFGLTLGFALVLGSGGANGGGRKRTNGAAGTRAEGARVSPPTTVSAACPINGEGRVAPRSSEAPAAMRMRPVSVIPTDSARWTRRVGRTQGVYEPSTIMEPRSPTEPPIPGFAPCVAAPPHSIGVFV